jgi:D-alanine-D-alanine ligase
MIDDSGCKGTRIGGAVISSKHGNYFINDANATEKDYADLMIFTMKKVFELYGIILTPEIKFINQETEKRVTTAIAPLKVLILKGGNSNERDISLQSAKEVEDALKSLGHKVRSIDIKTLEEWREINLEKGEVVFPVLHGGFGENGEIQKLFEADGVPFVGSGSSSCFLAMDKVESKKIMQQNNLPTPPFAYFDNSNAPFPENIELPIVVKPAVEGSTVGITLLKNKSKWSEALKLALQYSDRVIAEAYISGTEITVGVLDGKPLPVVEIKYPGELFDYDAKYEHKQGETEYICPAESLSLPIINRAQEVAVAFAESIDIRHLTRVDLIIAEDGTPYILEANNMPGFTSESLLPKAANAAGIPFPVLCSKLAVLANKK